MADHEIDARGLLCPEPIMLMHQAVRRLGVGAELQVITTDPAALRDVPQFCRFLGHALLQVDTKGAETLFRIKVKS